MNHHLKHPANRARFVDRSRVDRIVDSAVAFMGSPKFVMWQSAVIAMWITANILVVAFRFDPYPFILLNLLFSTQAAYAAPLILMAQNRQSAHDRDIAEHDYQINQEALQDVKEALDAIRRVEVNHNSLTSRVNRLLPPDLE